jgi:hypothetical protein
MAITDSSSPPVQFAHQISTHLSHDNFLLWKLQVVLILRGHDLMSYLDESKPVPAKMVSTTDDGVLSNLEYDRWIKQDQLILA